MWDILTHCRFGGPPPVSVASDARLGGPTSEAKSRPSGVTPIAAFAAIMALAPDGTRSESGIFGYRQMGGFVKGQRGRDLAIRT